MRLLSALLALLVASFLLAPRRAGAYVLLSHSLGLDQRDARVFDNLADPEANDNTAPHPSWPGATGAELAVWKALAEWGSRLHGDGAGDPSQPGDVGSGAAAFDISWQGAAPSPGGSGDNVVSALPLCGGGLIAFTEVGAGGWRIRLCDDWLWDDGPGTTLAAGALDIQGVLAHEFGHALGLAHSIVSGSTMYPVASGNGVAARSIEADDVSGLQALYGAAGAGKARIDFVLFSGGTLTVGGEGFAPSGNELWFTYASVNPSGAPVIAAGLVASQGGTRLELASLPALAGPGDLLVRVPGSTGAALSNAFPFDPQACSAPVTYCTAKVNSLGCSPAIGSSGQPGASAGSGFVVAADNVLNNVSGLFFYGTSGAASVPFQGGFLCLLGPVKRTPVQSSGGNPPPSTDCSGRFGLDFNAWIASGSDPSLAAGSEVYGQFWSRDPGSPSGSNLTDALALVVCP